MKEEEIKKSIKRNPEKFADIYISDLRDLFDKSRGKNERR